jgi:hypothetical protein
MDYHNASGQDERHNQERYHSADRKNRLALGLHAKSRLASEATPPSPEYRD